jgi:hypothetical protein
MADQCKYGHNTTAPNSRDASGFCRRCRKDRNQREYQKLRAAQDVVAMFEAAGCTFFDSDRQVTVSPEELAAQLVKVYGPVLD